MAILRIYTDGACSGNQHETNVGGWGAVLEYGQTQKELWGGERNTTNNRMEMTRSHRSTLCIEKDRSTNRSILRQRLSDGLFPKKMVYILAKKRLENRKQDSGGK